MTDDGRSKVTVHDALADYTQRCEVNGLERYPVMWAGHYADRDCLGQFTVAEIPEGRDPVAGVALGMLSPFGMSPEVDSAFLVIDALRVPIPAQAFETSQVLYITRLAATEAGVYATPFTVGLNDLGFAKPEQAAWYHSEVWHSVSAVINQRLGVPTLSWDDAFHAALDVARDALGD